MKTQTKFENLRDVPNADDERQLEVARDHSEIERVELLAAVLHDDFKDALTMCSVDMLETGKANAFAVYKGEDYIEVSAPILAEPRSQCIYDIDAKSNWVEFTEINKLLDDKSPKKQKALYEWDEEVGTVVPRKDVWAYIVSLPMGDFTKCGLDAEDIRRPTKDLFDLFVKQEKLHSGFICGVLTNDGKKSGLMLFKKSEQAQGIDRRSWGFVGYGEGVEKDIALGCMRESGVVYADIDLSCPKNADPDKIYNKRITQAVNTIY